LRDVPIEHPDITEMREKGFITDRPDVIEENTPQLELEGSLKKTKTPLV